MRRCIGNTPQCTGVNPCEGCLLAIITRVLPSAMQAGGFDRYEPPEATPEAQREKVQQLARAFFEAFLASLATIASEVAPQEEAVSAVVPAPPATEPSPAVRKRRKAIHTITEPNQPEQGADKKETP